LRHSRTVAIDRGPEREISTFYGPAKPVAMINHEANFNFVIFDGVTNRSGTTAGFRKLMREEYSIDAMLDDCPTSRSL
jgi:hypothetical protein